MTLDRIIGGIGLILSLPGFFLLFLNQNETVGAMSLLLGFVLFVGAVLHSYLANRPPFEMNSVEVRLEFKDSEARIARLSKSYEIRPNYGHLTTMTHRNIAADGAVQNLCWNDEPIPEANIVKVLGEFQVTVHFGIRKKGEVFTGKLSYEALDSFSKSHEGLVYVADFPTKVTWVHVQMPAGRRCSNVRATKIQGAGEVPLDPPQVNASGSSIDFTVRRPPVGAEYTIQWDW